MVQSERRRGGGRTRILYWFRTPPGVKVGRSALDADAMRAIEERYPGVEFDWPRILKGQAEPSAPPPPARGGEQERRARRQRDSRQSRGDEETARPPVPAEPATSARERPAASAREMDMERADSGRAPADSPPVENAPPAPDVIIPAHAILGADGVRRLRTRYADLAARIAGRVPDEAQRAQLKADADRLNPDTWQSEDDVRSALEAYEAVLESVRAVVGQPRKRRRRGETTEDQGSESV